MVSLPTRILLVSCAFPLRASFCSDGAVRNHRRQPRRDLCLTLVQPRSAALPGRASFYQPLQTANFGSGSLLWEGKQEAQSTVLLPRYGSGSGEEPQMQIAPEVSPPAAETGL